MRKTLVAGIALLAVYGVPAFAADMALKALPPAPIWNWTGFYVGIEGGAGWGRDRIGVNPGGFLTPVLHGSGGIVGGTLGFNWQSGMMVFGLEGDASLADIDPKGRDATVFPTCTAGGLGVCGTKLDFLGTARVRLGIALANNFLLYVTGGGAFGNLKASISNVAVTSSGSATKGGWVGGGGVEVMLGQYWSVKLEYLHVELGDGPSFLYAGGLTARSLNWNADIIRAGLNYRFGGPM